MSLYPYRVLSRQSSRPRPVLKLFLCTPKIRRSSWTRVSCLILVFESGLRISFSISLWLPYMSLHSVRRCFIRKFALLPSSIPFISKRKGSNSLPALSSPTAAILLLLQFSIQYLSLLPKCAPPPPEHNVFLIQVHSELSSRYQTKHNSALFELNSTVLELDPTLFQILPIRQNPMTSSSYEPASSQTSTPTPAGTLTSSISEYANLCKNPSHYSGPKQV